MDRFTIHGGRAGWAVGVVFRGCGEGTAVSRLQLRSGSLLVDDGGSGEGVGDLHVFRRVVIGEVWARYFGGKPAILAAVPLSSDALTFFISAMGLGRFGGRFCVGRAGGGDHAA